MRKFLLRLSLLLVLASAFPAAQAQDSIAKIDEWKEIMKLRAKFMQGQNGSNYLMGLFDGRFVGPNKESDFGLRSYTTAYDYLCFGNLFLSMLINLGYNADNVRFLPTDKVPHMHSYTLGCIQFYAISEEKRWVDSVFSTKLGRMVPADNPFYAKNSHLRIDSGQVVVDLAGVYRKQKIGKEFKYDSLLLKPIEGTGSWKDANNFDLVYEWMEVLYEANIDSFNIKKRPFSRRTPEQIKHIILERFDTKKYLGETGLSERDLDTRLKDVSGGDVFNFRDFPNCKIIRVGNWELFRYFFDIYYRDNSGPAGKMNPIWYNAYQYDKDVECNPKGYMNFILLSYGAGRYQMPTIIPKDLPRFTQFEGVVIYSSGTERQSHSNKDDIWINTINGRMVDKNFYEYPAEQGILPLNDDGTVDRIYKIYSWKDGKLYWAYIYCGKHAGVRGGKPGKSFVDQVDNFREQYNARDYWRFDANLDFERDVLPDMPVFVKNVKTFSEHSGGLAGKTTPRIRFEWTEAGKKKDEKIKITKFLVFNTDYTARLDPEGLIIPFKIVQTTDARLVKTNHIILNVLDDDVPLEDFKKYLMSHPISASEVQRFNKRWQREKELSPDDQDSIPLTTAYYNSQVFDLNNPNDVRVLLDKITMDIQGLEYQIPEAQSAVDWQKANRVDVQEAKLRTFEEEGKTGTEDYRKAVAEYDAQQEKLDALTKKLNNLKIKKEDLEQKKNTYNACYIKSLEQNLASVRTRKQFINDQIKDLQKQKSTLESEGKQDSPDYQQIIQSLRNKDSELKEATEKENEVLKTLADQQAGSQ
jgi:hypothetical protein